jgi:hypothetical protein
VLVLAMVERRQFHAGQQLVYRVARTTPRYRLGFFDRRKIAALPVKSLDFSIRGSNLLHDRGKLIRERRVALPQPSNDLVTPGNDLVASSLQPFERLTGQHIGQALAQTGESHVEPLDAKREIEIAQPRCRDHSFGRGGIEGSPPRLVTVCRDPLKLRLGLSDEIADIE